MNAIRKPTAWLVGLVGILVTTALFLVPFAFVFVTASRDANDAAQLQFSWPTKAARWSSRGYGDGDP